MAKAWHAKPLQRIPHNRVLDNPMSEFPTRSTRVYRLFYPWMRSLLSLLWRLLAPRLRMTGQNNIPRRGGVLLCPNHISDVDPTIVQNASPRLASRSLWFMAKRELFGMTVPLIGKLGPKIEFLQTFPVDPHEPDRDALKHAAELLKAGQCLVVFPEGFCSPDGEMNEIQAGAVMLALRGNVPIVPVGLWNTTGVMPYGSIVLRPTWKRVAIHFGKPLRFDDLKDKPKREAREIATQRLTEAMRQAREVAKNG